MTPRVSVRLLQVQSDRRLLELVGRGYERAFEALVLRYQPPLLAYCRRLGLQDARADDVVQQALLKAWLALREGTVVRDARPWLFRITHNTAVNALRGRSVEHVSIASAPELVAVGSDSAVEGRIAARQALSEVASLPPMQRDVVLMSAVDGRSHAEVADALGISPGAVRGLLYRARAALRSAAAALTPQPLLAWAASGGGGAPTAGRLLEISSSGSGDLGAGLLKGVALGITAALAAGAVVVPRAVHHPRPSSRLDAAAHGTGPTAAGRPGAASLVSHLVAVPGATPVSTGSRQGAASAGNAAGGRGRDGGHDGSGMLRGRDHRGGSGERISGGGRDAAGRDGSGAGGAGTRDGGDRRSEPGDGDSTASSGGDGGSRGDGGSGGGSGGGFSPAAGGSGSGSPEASSGAAELDGGGDRGGPGGDVSPPPEASGVLTQPR